MPRPVTVTSQPAQRVMGIAASQGLPSSSRLVVSVACAPPQATEELAFPRLSLLDAHPEVVTHRAQLSE